MAARTKKNASLPETGQETGHAPIGGPVMAEAMIHESFDSGDNGDNAANPVSLPMDFSNSEQLAAASSEVIMDANMEITEAEASDTVMADEAVEPEIMLDANVSIQNVVKLYEKVKKSYAAYDAIEIDASHVASIDTAALQLFVALKKDAIKQKKEVNFFQPSPRFIESARLLDLLDILEITYV